MADEEILSWIRSVHKMTGSDIAGMEWVVSHTDPYGVGVTNISLGADGCGDGTAPAAAAVDEAVDAGITAVVAAGNAGASRASCTRAPRR
jgi:serine protease AprX